MESYRSAAASFACTVAAGAAGAAVVVGVGDAAARVAGHAALTWPR